MLMLPCGMATCASLAVDPPSGPRCSTGPWPVLADAVCRSCDVDPCADLASRTSYPKAKLLMKANILGSDPSVDAAPPVWVLKLPAH